MSRQAVIEVADLPGDALSSAAAFHATYVVRAEEVLANHDAVLFILPDADYEHTDWRRGAVRTLARRYAPKRVNMIAASDFAAIEAMTDYLGRAKAITGQYLPAHREGVRL